MKMPHMRLSRIGSSRRRCAVVVVVVSVLFASGGIGLLHNNDQMMACATIHVSRLCRAATFVRHTYSKLTREWEWDEKTKFTDNPRI